mgnify:FL=1
MNVEFDICLYDSGGVSLFYLTSNCFCYETENVFSDARFRSMRSGYAKL